MNKVGIGLMTAIAILISGVSPAQAWWHGPHVWIGGPVWYPYPYYAPPVVVQPPAPVVVQPPQPPSYVQRPDTVHDSYWYYCESSKGYYPYVKECPGGWMRVPPVPSSRE
jgi:hypothetical protein